MEKEILEFIRKNALQPFNKEKTVVKQEGFSLFKTRDAKAVHQKVLTKISNNFNFKETENLFSFLEFTENIELIRKRQEFFRGFNKKIENSFLKDLKAPRKSWKPKYGVLVVTEEDSTFNELQEMGCPVKLLIGDNDVSSLEEYELIQVIDCPNYGNALERLPQAIFLNSSEEAYVERYLEELSGWKDNLPLLERAQEEDITRIALELKEFIELIDVKAEKKISRENVEESLDSINKEIALEVKKMTLSGDLLFNMLSKNELPSELKKVIRDGISKSGFPDSIFKIKLPLEIDEQELDKMIKKQSDEGNSKFAEIIRKKAEKIRKIPEKLKLLSELVIYYDFISGISKYNAGKDEIIEINPELKISESHNLFLDNPKPISFSLNDMDRCSILTGANSGGKTTLLEHIIQLISLSQMGLPVSGRVSIPLFSEVYYFAKNKGSANKGALETLLSQMSKINSGNKTLILADEIESVTEPGVAGVIVAASAEYFLEKGCFLVIATHLGKEIQKILPKNARIDGIEAKGLDENFELIVDHNPVLGRLANSTPELIVEKMANSEKNDYFYFLNEYLKKRN